MSYVFKKTMMNLVIKPTQPIAGWYFRASPNMITCKEFNNFIFNYTEGLLSEDQTKLFERHMKFCPTCRNFLKSYIAAYKAGKVLLPYKDLDVPSIVPKDLLEAISHSTEINIESPP